MPSKKLNPTMLAAVAALEGQLSAPQIALAFKVSDRTVRRARAILRQKADEEGGIYISATQFAALDRCYQSQEVEGSPVVNSVAQVYRALEKLGFVEWVEITEEWLGEPYEYKGWQLTDKGRAIYQENCA